MVNELSKPLDNIGTYAVNKEKLISYRKFSNDEIKIIYNQYENILQFVNNKKCLKTYKKYEYILQLINELQKIFNQKDNKDFLNSYKLERENNNENNEDDIKFYNLFQSIQSYLKLIYINYHRKD